MKSLDGHEKLRAAYQERDVEGIIRSISSLMKDPQFSTLYRRLTKEGKITSTAVKIEELASALLYELEDEFLNSGELIAEDNFFDIAEELKREFGEELSEIYINTKIPSDFMLQVRQERDQSDASRISDSLISRYRDELIRMETGRRAIVDKLQKHSNFPVTNAKAVSSLLHKLHIGLKSNYAYVSVKPYFSEIYIQDGESASDPAADSEESALPLLFTHYANSGEEPALLQQVKFRIAVNKLFQFLWKRKLLPMKEYKRSWSIITHVFDYRGVPGLAPKVWYFLDDLLTQVNDDQTAILKKLAKTFVAEYRCAEEQMRIRNRMIETELAYTKEYLNQLDLGDASITAEQEEKIRVAQEKVIGLEGIFDVAPVIAQAAIRKPFLELERSALGISTVIPSRQIADWIHVYSILFSNAEFLAHANEEVEFSVMRKLISDLTTYHLILNIAQLKTAVDRALGAGDDLKTDHFKRFNDALRHRLHGLINKKKEQEKSLREMIEELGFLDNEAIQFVVADTFKGFQAIVDAFNETATDYFVRDREALIRESRQLYSQICDQCFKNFEKRPHLQGANAGSRKRGQAKRSWFGRMFSS